MGELAKAERPELAAMSGPLHAAERHTRVGSNHLVDEHHSSFDFVGEPLLLGRIVGPGAGAQTEAAVVGDSNRFVDILDAKYRRDGTEQLLAIGGRFFRNV